jgi:hypothetical protein
VSAIKKAVKKVGRFVRRNWKSIAIAAAVVFTSGIATVGTAGFTMAGAGKGFGATLGAIGKTMVAGVQAIGGSLGIGQGASLGGFGGSGYATLGTGAAAQSLGLAGSNAAMTAGRVAQMGATAPGQAGYGVLMNSANPAAAATTGGAQIAGGMGGSLGVGVGSGAGGAATGGGGFFSNPNSGMLLQAGMGLVNGYMQGRAQDEDWERTKPRGYWGVGLNGTPNASGPLMASNGPMWSWESWKHPGGQAPQPSVPQGPPAPHMLPPGFTGNAAIDGGQEVDPYASEMLNSNNDPTAVHVGAPSRGRNI